MVTFLTGAVGKITLVEDGNNAVDPTKKSRKPCAESPRP